MTPSKILIYSAPRQALFREYVKVAKIFFANFFKNYDKKYQKLRMAKNILPFFCHNGKNLLPFLPLFQKYIFIIMSKINFLIL